MPTVPVTLPNGDTWIVSPWEILISIDTVLREDWSAQDIGEHVLGLISRIQAVSNRLQGSASYESLEMCEAGISRPEVPPEVSARIRRRGFVYIVQWEHVYKIGRTKSPHARLQPMGAKFPSPLTVRMLIPTDDMDETEDTLHERFADVRLGGEWFALTAEDLATLTAEYPTIDHSQLRIG